MQRPSRASWASAIFSALEAFFCESLVACERVVSTVKRVDGPASRRLAIAGALILLAGASTSKAAVIFSDNFDGYANQAALQAAWPTIATTTDTTKQNIQLSTAQAQSTANSVYVPVSTTATTTSMEYRNRRSFSETSTQSTSGNLGIGDQIVWSFDFYDTNPAGSPQRNFANLRTQPR